MENEKFITILTTTFGSEIAVIRGRLESEGITCFIQDEFTIQVNPLYSNAIGGVKLQVMENDLKQAIEILKETGYIKDNDLPPPNYSTFLNGYSDEQQNENDEMKLFCPTCGSEEVVITKKAGWLFLVTSLILLPFCSVFTPFFQKKYYCFNCKKEVKLNR